MKRVLQLWFVFTLAVGMICAPVKAIDPEEESDDKLATGASATGGSSATRAPVDLVVQNDVAAGVSAHNVVNPKNSSGNTDLAASSKSPDQKEGTGFYWEKLPKELLHEIVLLMHPEASEQFSRTSEKMRAEVRDAFEKKLGKALKQESQSAVQDPTGRELPNMGLPFFKSAALPSKICEALDRMPKDIRNGTLEKRLDSYGFFAARGVGIVASAADRLEGIHYENMHAVILQALGDTADELGYKQKAALQHQFLRFDFYYKTPANKSKWIDIFRQKIWAPEAGGGLLAFIDNTYQEITSETPAIDTDQNWVVRYSQLAELKDHINGLLPENADTPQPTVVIDIDAESDNFNMTGSDLPERLRNLVLTNVHKNVTSVDENFLNESNLQVLEIDLPALARIKAESLGVCDHLQTVYLHLPALKTIEEFLLYSNPSLNKVNLHARAVAVFKQGLLWECNSIAVPSISPYGSIQGKGEFRSSALKRRVQYFQN